MVHRCPSVRQEAFRDSALDAFFSPGRVSLWPPEMVVSSRLIWGFYERRFVVVHDQKVIQHSFHAREDSNGNWCKLGARETMP